MTDIEPILSAINTYAYIVYLFMGVVGVIFLVLLRVAWNISGWKSTVDTRLVNIEGDINSIKSILYLRGSSLAQGRSPISLTQLGKEIAEGIGASDIADRYTSQLKEALTDFSAYKVQEACLDYAEKEVFNNLDDDTLKTIEDLAFEKGEKVDIIVRIVIGITLRDKMLGIFGMTHLDVDSTAPSVEHEQS